MNRDKTDDIDNLDRRIERMSWDYETHRSWRRVLADQLPERLANSISMVLRNVDGAHDFTTIVYTHKHIILHEPWLSDAFIARVALEAPQNP
jgi:hypothetical protein